MKTIKYLSLRVFAVAALALVFALPTKAQMTDNGYANIDWQYNFPLSNNFADKSSGWGMNFEGGYFLTDNFALGAFLNYHSKTSDKFALLPVALENNPHYPIHHPGRLPTHHVQSPEEQSSARKDQRKKV